jgi:hypothetical protein
MYSAALFNSLRPLLVVFCLGWESNFVGSESGQIHSVHVLYMLTTKPDTPFPPPPFTHCIKIHTPVNIHTGKVGGGGRQTSEKVRGALCLILKSSM